MEIRQAWFCPSCQKHHAPHCDTCPAGGLVAGPKPGFFEPRPVKYWPTDRTFDPCAGCKGPCGNVACPKLPVATCGYWDQATGGAQ